MDLLPCEVPYTFRNGSKGATRPQPQVIRPEKCKAFSSGNLSSGAFNGDAKQIPRALTSPSADNQIYYRYSEPGRQPSGEDVSHPMIELTLKLLGVALWRDQNLPALQAVGLKFPRDIYRKRCSPGRNQLGWIKDT